MSLSQRWRRQIAFSVCKQGNTHKERSAQMFAQEESNDLQEHNQEVFFFYIYMLSHTHTHSLIVVAINWKMIPWSY